MSSEQIVPVELVGCPWCENPPGVCPDTSYGSALVFCADDNDCPVHPVADADLTVGETVEDAKRRWNNRLQHPIGVDEVEALRSALELFALRANRFDGVPPAKYFGDIDGELRYHDDLKLEVTLGELRKARAAISTIRQRSGGVGRDPDDLLDVLRPFHWEAFFAGVRYERDEWPGNDEHELEMKRGIDSVAVGEHFEGWRDETVEKILAALSPVPIEAGEVGPLDEVFKRMQPHIDALPKAIREARFSADQSPTPSASPDVSQQARELLAEAADRVKLPGIARYLRSGVQYEEFDSIRTSIAADAIERALSRPVVDREALKKALRYGHRDFCYPDASDGELDIWADNILTLFNQPTGNSRGEGK